MRLYKVQDHPDLVKDMDSKAILNTNYAALLEYKKKQQIYQDVDDLRNDINDIKETLNVLVSLLNK